jgi:lactoylglutathione lyase
MVRVDELSGAVEFYTRVLGLRELWRDETSVGMAMVDSDAEVVLHTMDLPAEYGVHYLVDDVAGAVATCERAGCAVREAPFDVAVGRCAVVVDPFGNAICLLDMSKGRRAA